MPFGGLGMGEIILILVVLLLVFGARRLPELGGALGKGIREFKKSVREIEDEFAKPADDSREIRGGQQRQAVPPPPAAPQEPAREPQAQESSRTET